MTFSPLSDIIRSILLGKCDKGKFPSDGKKTHVTPTHKKGGK